jgi:glyceraldehyde 3-phosphate dehydrogenase
MTQKKIKVGINGFGRIGRTIFRQNVIQNNFDVVLINDINSNVENIAYQLKYDSTHGPLWGNNIFEKNNKIYFDHNEICVTHEELIDNVPWENFDVDIVIGCTGIIENVNRAKNCLKGSVQKVIFTDSPKNVDITLVMGVNHHNYDSDNHNVIAGSICDVVGVAPLIKLLNAEFKIDSGFLLTLHPWLVYQNILDGNPHPDVIADPNGAPHAIGRGSAISLIPKNTSLVGALERALPEVEDKFKAMSYRVPTDIVGSLHAVIVFRKGVSKEELKNHLSESKNIPYFDYTDEPLISVDYKHHKSSCVVDGKWIEIINENTARFVTWYDNEWGYSARFVEAIDFISKKL